MPVQLVHLEYWWNGPSCVACYEDIMGVYEEYWSSISPTKSAYAIWPPTPKLV